MAVGAMMLRSSTTTTTSATPATAAVGTVGRRKRSRVRSTVAPRSRSWGSTSNTPNSTIMGRDTRKLPTQVHLSPGAYPMT
jgi:hypothetical protein